MVTHRSVIVRFCTATHDDGGKKKKADRGKLGSINCLGMRVENGKGNGEERKKRQNFELMLQINLLTCEIQS